MNDNVETGKSGEEIAVNYLLNKGYKVLERNWRYKHYEVDIIAENTKFLVVVEVKFRSYTTYGAPELWVNKQKQKFLKEAINQYIIQKNIDKEVRFDIIAISLKNNRLSVHHIEDAFFVG